MSASSSVSLVVRHLAVSGRMPEAMNEVSNAIELDPVSPLFNTVRAEMLCYQRQYDRAMEQIRPIPEAYPNFWLANYWLGTAYREKRMYAQAVEQFRNARELSHDNPAMIMAYGHAQALAGNAAEARRALSDLKNLSQKRYIPSVYFAGIYLRLGDKDKTFAELERAYQERNDRLIYLGIDPI
jgi:tetratricopeptide (TPR) repeat protein